MTATPAAAAADDVDYLDRTDLQVLTVRLPPVIIERLQRECKEWHYASVDEVTLAVLRRGFRAR